MNRRRLIPGSLIAAGLIVLTGCASDPEVPPPPRETHAVVIEPPVAALPVVRVPLECADLVSNELIESTFGYGLPTISPYDRVLDTALYIAARQQNGDLACAWSTGSLYDYTSARVVVNVVPFIGEYAWRSLAGLFNTQGETADPDSHTSCEVDSCRHIKRLGDYAIEVEARLQQGGGQILDAEPLFSSIGSVVAAAPAPTSPWAHNVRQHEASCDFFDWELMRARLGAQEMESLMMTTSSQRGVANLSASEVSYDGCYVRANGIGASNIVFEIEYLPEGAWAHPALREARALTTGFTDLPTGDGFSYSEQTESASAIAVQRTKLFSVIVTLSDGEPPTQSLQEFAQAVIDEIGQHLSR